MAAAGAPFDYTTSQQPQPTNMSDTVFGGMKAGMDLKAEMDKNRLEKMKIAQMMAMQQELGQVASNPTPDALLKLSIKYPSLSEGFKRAQDMLTPIDQKARLDRMLPVHAALNAGNTDAAVKVLQEQADALRNSGKEQEAATAENMIKVVQTDPRAFNTSAGILLAGVLGPEKYAENFVKIQEAPASAEEAAAKAAKTTSEAITAAVNAKFAESEALAKLKLTQEQANHYAEDIAIRKRNTEIATLNAQIARETNGLRQQELRLKVQQATQAREDAINQRAAAVSQAHATIDNMNSTIDQALNTPFKVVKAATGPISSEIKTFDPAVADFEELIKTVGSQTFLNQFMSLKGPKGSTGLGALSDAEGKKLEMSLRSLSLRQSPERLLANLTVVKDLMDKAKTNISVKFGTGAAAASDNPAAGNPTIDGEY